MNTSEHAIELMCPIPVYIVGKTEQDNHGDVSTSELVIEPNPSQDEQILTCR